MLTNARPRVLYVDDDEDSREVLSLVLKALRIDAIGVGTAGEALALSQAARFDIYVLDAWLPDLDGFELCRRLHAIDPHAPILFFSGAAYESDKKKGREAGADRYVTKPHIGELIRTISQLVERDLNSAARGTPASREVKPPLFVSQPA